MAAVDKIMHGRKKRFFNFSINKRLQLSLLIRIWITLLAALIVFGAIFYFYSDKTVGMSYRQFHVRADNFLDLLLPVIFIGFGVSLVLGVIAALFFPNSIAGPIYRMEKALLEIGKGDLNMRVKLRKNDSCKGLAESLNTMATGIRDRVKRIDDCSKKLADIADRPDDEMTVDLLKDIRTVSETLQASINKFNL